MNWIKNVFCYILYQIVLMCYLCAGTDFCSFRFCAWLSWIQKLDFSYSTCTHELKKSSYPTFFALRQIILGFDHTISDSYINLRFWLKKILAPKSHQPSYQLDYDINCCLNFSFVGFVWQSQRLLSNVVWLDPSQNWLPNLKLAVILDT